MIKSFVLRRTCRTPGLISWSTQNTNQTLRNIWCITCWLLHCPFYLSVEREKTFKWDCIVTENGHGSNYSLNLKLKIISSGINDRSFIYEKKNTSLVMKVTKGRCELYCISVIFTEINLKQTVHEQSVHVLPRQTNIYLHIEWIVAMFLIKKYLSSNVWTNIRKIITIFPQI